MDFDAPDGDVTGFNMNGEFEGGQFIDGEFYYSSRRAAPTQSKDSQIYGIFDDEEEAPPSSFKSRRGGKLHAGADSVLSGGSIQFVSRGVVQSAAQPEPDEEVKTEPVARAPLKPVAKVIEKGFGKFEDHTKGFGMKMLLKMGFKGRLGKNEDGRVNPILPTLRKQGEALQGVARKDKETMDAERETTPAPVAVEQEVFESREVNWKKGKRKERTVYKTAAQLLATEIALTTAPTPEKYQIIDHRGPSVKILSGEQISTARDEAHSWAPTANAHQLPELQHNLKLLVEMTEEDILKIKREITQTETRFSGLKQSREKVEAGLKREGSAITRVQEALQLVDKFVEDADKSKGQPVTDRLDIAANALDTIHHRFPAEWERFGLANLAEPQVFPLIKALLHSWEPLEKTQTSQSRAWMARLTRWKVILEDDPDVLKRMWEQTLVPSVFIAISAQWQPRDFVPCVRLLTDLQELLPEDLWNQIRYSAITRVKKTVDDWDPRTDAVPVHSWILPWRDLSPEQEMQPIYEVLQAKLSSVLRDWHPSDTSAFAVISPWQDVFLKQNFEALLARSILPKLHAALRSMTVNPAAQQVDPFQWAMTWANLIPSRVMVQLLRLEFFPKWFSALYAWLSRDPNFEEVSKWYMGWRTLIPEVLRDTLDVKQILNRGLDLMRLSINDPKSLASAYATIEQELKNPTAVPAAKPTPEKPDKVVRAAPPSDPSLSFKEIIQKFADMHGVEFVPNSKRGFVDGKQVFSFGKVAIYLDNRTIFASLQDASGSWSWSPLGLQDLLEKAR